MLVKSLTVLAASAAVAVAFAGGNTHYNVAQSAAPMSSSAFTPSAYADLNAGMDWSGLSDANSGSKFKSMSGNPFVFGLDVGYNFMPHLAVELGGTYFMAIEGKSGSTAGLADGKELKQYDIYGALKMSAAVMNNLVVFGKAGMDYLHVKNTSVGKSSDGQFAPTFGAGLEYNFMPQWRASLQWRRVAAITDHSKVAKVGTMPNQDLVTVGVGYVFPVG